MRRCERLFTHGKMKTSVYTPSLLFYSLTQKRPNSKERLIFKGKKTMSLYLFIGSLFQHITKAYTDKYPFKWRFRRDKLETRGR